jgi:hypothetical protein
VNAIAMPTMTATVTPTVHIRRFRPHIATSTQGLTSSRRWSRRGEDVEFDSRFDPSDDPFQMVRRLGALLLVAALLAGNAASLDCAGWEPSAADRMECCLKADHGCPDQVAANQCCAAGELAKQSAPTPSIAAVSAPAVSLVVHPPFFVVSSAVSTIPTLSNHPQSPPHFRRTVLLI